ncbi:hypothetical protein ACJVC5_17780 [Peredibacter sp. HCB2-198]|uniref:hypothetical protein n=1 Tax=Peredibacter sp. HCB2-198 TaxID=3383025 RepID=UPI0038B5F48E
MAKLWIKYALLIGTALATFIFFFTKPAMPQELSYHLFVDQRMFWNIPNTLDVLSNLAFLIVGFLGLKESFKITSPVRNSWIAFFASILLVAPGSAFYHWAPNNYTLIWDRLPMSTGFMALYVVMLAEHISLKFTKVLPWALLMGLVSVLVWVATDDLRFYFWVQFSSFLTVPMILLAFTSRYTHKGWFGVTLLFYALAKWTEVKDKEVFLWTHEMVSGHTLKHVLAAIGLMGVWWMLKVRSETASDSELLPGHHGT